LRGWADGGCSRVTRHPQDFTKIAVKHNGPDLAWPHDQG